MTICMSQILEGQENVGGSRVNMMKRVIGIVTVSSIIRWEVYFHSHFFSIRTTHVFLPFDILQECDLKLRRCRCEPKYQLQQDGTTPCEYNPFGGRTYDQYCNEESQSYCKEVFKCIDSVFVLIVICILYSVLRPVTLKYINPYIICKVCLRN